jgi:hypothetical protein
MESAHARWSNLLVYLLLGGILLGLVAIATSIYSFNQRFSRAESAAIATRAADLTAVQFVATSESEVAGTATAQAAYTALSNGLLWPIVFFDRFDDNSNDWPESSLLDEFLVGGQSVTQNKYVWEVEAQQGFVLWALPLVSEVGDFSLSVDVQQQSGAGIGLFGVIFRVLDDDNFYMFQIGDDGSIFAGIRQAGMWESILPFTPAMAIQPGIANKITVAGQGGQFYFYVNGEFVGGLFDARLGAGRVGVIAGLDEGGQHAVIQFDNFELRAP